MPEIELALNEDLVIGAKPGTVGYGRVGLDDVNFHECVRLDRWDRERTLVINPPDGEVEVGVLPFGLPILQLQSCFHLRNAVGLHQS